MFSIKSNSSNREIVFRSRKNDRFQITLKGNVEVTTEVWAYNDEQGLNKFFQEIAAEGKPWKGKKEWASLEGEFLISATCSTLGEVQFWLKLCGLQGAPEEWKVEVGLTTELGQLEKIANKAKVFFA